jgi:hypothetical protein
LRINLGIATLIGLFIGTILAFGKHYISEWFLRFGLKDRKVEPFTRAPESHPDVASGRMNGSHPSVRGSAPRASGEGIHRA